MRWSKLWTLSNGLSCLIEGSSIMALNSSMELIQLIRASSLEACLTLQTSFYLVIFEYLNIIEIENVLRSFGFNERNEVIEI